MVAAVAARRGRGNLLDLRGSRRGLTPNLASSYPWETHRRQWRSTTPAPPRRMRNTSPRARLGPRPRPHGRDYGCAAATRWMTSGRDYATPPGFTPACKDHEAAGTPAAGEPRGPEHALRGLAADGENLLGPTNLRRASGILALRPPPPPPLQRYTSSFEKGATACSFAWRR